MPMRYGRDFASRHVPAPFEAAIRFRPDAGWARSTSVRLRHNVLAGQEADDDEQQNE
jgi:hypothetical protein